MRGWNENPKVHFKERISEVSAPSEAAVAETLQREGQFANTKTLGEKLLFGDILTEKEKKDSDSDGKKAEFEEADFAGPDDEEDSEERPKSDSNDKDDDDEQSTEEQKKEDQSRVRREKKDAAEDGSHEAAVAEDRSESLPPLKRRHGKAAKDPTHRSRSPYRKEQAERREKTHRSLYGKNDLQTVRACMETNLQKSLVRRSAINVEGAGSRKDLEHHRVRLRSYHDVHEQLPATVGSSNIMIANWVVGIDASAEDLARILEAAPFDCVVIVLTTAVAENDPIARFLKDLVDSRDRFERSLKTHPFLSGVLAEKAVYNFTSKVYIAIHRAKVKGFRFVERSLPGGSASMQSAASTQRNANFGRTAVAESMTKGTLYLQMDQTRQRLKEFRLGIVDMRQGECSYVEELNAMEAWIVSDRLAALTGWFGDNHHFVKEVAEKTKAIGCEPFAQWLNVFNANHMGWRTITMPNYFLLFGYYRKISVPHDACRSRGSWKFGLDLWNETILQDILPRWAHNDVGSPFVPHHGAIKMKDVDFTRWVGNIFQTCLWMGTSTPSKSSQEKQKNLRRGASSKGKNKKGKGNGTN